LAISTFQNVALPLDDTD